MLPILIVIQTALLFTACRSTNRSLQLDERSALESGFTVGEQHGCFLDGKGRARCLFAPVSTDVASAETSSLGWRPLLASGRSPALSLLASRGQLSCGVSKAPQSIQAQFLCWKVEPSLQLKSPSDKKSGFAAYAFKNRYFDETATMALSQEAICLQSTEGQLACGRFDWAQKPPQVDFKLLTVLPKLTGLKAGNDSFCGIADDKKQILCWQSQEIDSLDSAILNQILPQELLKSMTLPTPAVLLEMGTRHGCTVDIFGEVFCFGDNSQFQLGVEPSPPSEAQDDAVEIAKSVRGLPMRAIGLALGESSSCALLIDGTVWCWGAAGQLGDDSIRIEPSLIPVQVRLPKAAKAIEAGRQQTCARLEDASIHCWGTWLLPKGLKKADPSLRLPHIFLKEDSAPPQNKPNV